MDGNDLPSSSDESDADFVPKEEDYKSVSGSEESDYESSGGEENNKKSVKRKKRSKKGSKKAKTHIEKEEEKEDESKEEEKKIDVDALWADFKKDVNNLGTKKTAESLTAKPESLTESKSSETSNPKGLAIPKSKGLPSFQSRTKTGGLSNVLNQIGKKDKMSTLKKSQLDWNNFKKSEGIEEEIKTYNKGKDGYLDKQDFLQRTDLRQFEIEKELRNTRRKF